MRTEGGSADFHNINKFRCYLQQRGKSNNLGQRFVLRVLPSFFFFFFLLNSALINFLCVTTFPELQPERKVDAGTGKVNVMEELWLQIPTVSSS